MKMDELKGMSAPELERLWERKRDELLRIRQVLDRKKGEGIERNVFVDFEEYVKE